MLRGRSVQLTWQFFISISIWLFALAACQPVQPMPTGTIPPSAEPAVISMQTIISATDNLVVVPVEVFTDTEVLSNTFVIVPADIVTATEELTDALAVVAIESLDEIPTEALVIVSDTTPCLVLTETLDLVPNQALTLTSDTPLILKSVKTVDASRGESFNLVPQDREEMTIEVRSASPHPPPPHNIWCACCAATGRRVCCRRCH